MKKCDCNTCLKHHNYWKNKPKEDATKTKYQQILNHLIRTNQGFCFVAGGGISGIVSREDCIIHGAK